MCGIAALFAFKEGLPLSALHSMTACVAHRGPDDEGYVCFREGRMPAVLGGPATPKEVWAAPFRYCPQQAIEEEEGTYEVLLGHRRLSILELSASGHQPMSSVCGRFWVTYNGEIFNCAEIRRKLEQLGRSFSSKSDTEVLIQAYMEWGETCLNQFNGMFAFALYDRDRRSVFIARDRFGVKPLYYWQSPLGFLAIASEIKQFTLLPGWQRQVHPQRVYDFLTAGIKDHTADTLFAHVKQLRGGEKMTLTPTSLTISRWYTLPEETFSGTEEEASARFFTLFEDAVGLRLHSDVPIGFCLSGGLDSSSIVCMAKSLLPASQRSQSFSACFQDARYDERKFIEIVNAHCGLEGHPFYLSSEELFEKLPTLIWHQDEPFISTSIYAQWKVFQLAKEKGIKVVLDGQGADEQLAGYPCFFYNQLFELWQARKWVQLGREWGRIWKNYPGLLPHPLHLAFRSLRRALFSAPGPAWLHSDKLGALPHSFFSNAARQTIQARSHCQLTCSNLPMLLHFEDRDSMAHSVESRTPFLDYRLVEFVYTLPSAYKLGEGVTKRVLRKGMNALLPAPIAQRRDKLGFSPPEATWMKEEKEYLSHLSRAIERSGGILDRSLMQRAEKQYDPLFWRIVTLGSWLERFDLAL